MESRSQKPSFVRRFLARREVQVAGLFRKWAPDFEVWSAFSVVIRVRPFHTVLIWFATLQHYHYISSPILLALPLSLPVSYSGLHTQTCIPRPPSAMVFDGCFFLPIHTGFLRKMGVQEM